MNPGPPPRQGGVLDQARRRALVWVAPGRGFEPRTTGFVHGGSYEHQASYMSDPVVNSPALYLAELPRRLGVLVLWKRDLLF